MLQKPKVGGLPTSSIEGITPGVNEVWGEVRGVSKCGFTKVGGVKNMVLLSIEYYVDEDVAKLKGWMHPDCKPIESSPVWNKDNNYNEDKYYPYIGNKPKTNNILEEGDIEKHMALINEYYSEDTDPIRQNHIARKLGYATKQLP